MYNTKATILLNRAFPLSGAFEPADMKALQSIFDLSRRIALRWAMNTPMPSEKSFAFISRDPVQVRDLLMVSQQGE
ncbi:hypothetical protein [Mycoplana dimorpha]|uniref:hypothetical protein n=1 Tax=Mycoplana dimorpha TaxID=28320 RepID=UPI0011B1E40B|nr:hypothetical protein [Mycoplana dimorpha]